MKIQSITAGIRQHFTNNTNPVNRNKVAFSQRNLNCDVYEACTSKVSFGSLPNFGEVIQSKLFRGGAPSAENFKKLAEQGIGMIIDLCDMPLRREAELAKEYGILYKNEPFDISKMTESGSLSKIKEAIDEAIKGDKAVFVHCEYGKNRTGVALAYYQLKSGVPFEQVEKAYLSHGGYPIHLKMLPMLMEAGLI